MPRTTAPNWPPCPVGTKAGAEFLKALGVPTTVHEFDCDSVAAIEAEAARDAIGRLVPRIKGMSIPPGPDFAWVDGHRPFIAAVLAILDEAVSDE